MTDLRRLAEAATPGPWDFEDTTEVTGYWDPDADAAYIAAANPQAVLALLDALDAATERVARLRDVEAAACGWCELWEEHGTTYRDDTARMAMNLAMAQLRRAVDAAAREALDA